MEEDKIVEQELKYEEKREDYTRFWQQFIGPLKDIAKALQEKNKVHAESNKLLRSIEKKLDKKWGK